MPSLKSLRDRTKVVKSTFKITSAMKMVAASKLRRHQTKWAQTKPSVTFISEMIQKIFNELDDQVNHPFLNPSANGIPLILVITGDKGLCGHFNESIIQKALIKIRDYKKTNQAFNILFWGKKGFDGLKNECHDYFLDPSNPFFQSSVIDVQDVSSFVSILYTAMSAGLVSSLDLYFGKFQSVLKQEGKVIHLLPFKKEPITFTNKTDIDFEPKKKTLLKDLLIRYCIAQLYQYLCETLTSEQASRMTAMDLSSRNAKDMIKKLELKYNRTRQTLITKELIEIISGSESIQAD
jgi:F-type H+-transporting ATPase subunit gamma